MQYFEEDFINFFKDLENNNHKEWFDINRTRYEKIIKNPFKNFVQNLIIEIAERDEESRGIEAKDCLFRINRDIRFSNDKTPYKTNVSAVVGPGGKKEMARPGIYIEFSHKDLRLYTGAYMPDKEQLHALRYHILQHQKEFLEITRNEIFVKNFGQILGDKNKRLDSEFLEIGEEVPEIYNKQFYVFKKYPSSLIHSPKLMEQLLKDYEILSPFKHFLRDGLDLLKG